MVSKSAFYGADIILEGEVYAGVGTFEQVKGWCAMKGYVPPKGDWADKLSFNIFDIHVESKNNTFGSRYDDYVELVRRIGNDRLHIISQYPIPDNTRLNQIYSDIIKHEGEGLMFKNKTSTYKYGRSTENEGSAFKMKDDAIDYGAVIIDVEEGTFVAPSAETGTNELGYSTTSKLKEDRIPNGRAKTLRCIVHIDDYFVEQSVSLSGFDNRDKEEMLAFKTDWIGKRIIVKGMKPTIIKGKVRGCSYRK